jgi:hypothetical protein
MKCDICDEEFDTENLLLQHKAKMHAGESAEGTMPEPEDKEGMPPDQELEEPDFKRAANE